MKTKLTKYYNLGIRAIIIIGTLIFLYYQLFTKRNIIEFVRDLPNLIAENFSFLIIIVILMMPLNWLIESVKWKFIISKTEKISLLTSVKAVFAGISISSLSPNRIGEYFGRIFVLKKTGMWEAVVMTVLGSIAQTMVTIFFGFNSVFLIMISYFSKYEIIEFKYLILLYISALLGFAFLFYIYLNISKVGEWFNSVNNKYLKHLRILSKYQKVELIKVFSYSVLRYIVFSLQFFFLMKAFGLKLDIFISLALISSVFFISTVIPTIALLEVGIRGSISILVFSFFYRNFLGVEIIPEMKIFFTTTTLWLVNLVLPSLLGLIFIKDIKFFKSKKSK